MAPPMCQAPAVNCANSDLFSMFNPLPLLVDTHVHLFDPTRFSYPWTQGYPALHKREFSMEDYKEAAGERVEQALFMEVDVAAEQSLDEARLFLEQAELGDSPLVGVVAACRPEHPDFKVRVDLLASHSRLKGFRRILHTQPDGLSRERLFRENIRWLGEKGYPFDLCLLGRQLPLGLKLARACPETIFVLNHCGVPGIAGEEDFVQWQRDLAALAVFSNVICKVSGIIAYVGDSPSVESLRPFVETCVEAFGIDRLVWGSDFPVCNLTANLSSWIAITEQLFSGEDPETLAAIFGGNARRVYRLESA